MNIFVIDTETTGLDPAVDRVVEIAAVEMSLADGAWSIGAGAVSFVNPRRPIPPEASAVHHILDADVAAAPDMLEAIDKVLPVTWRDSVDLVAAHNARFDLSFLPMLKEKRWIDTYRCALHVWPDAPRHNNCTLFYWLGCPRPAEVRAHSALFDAHVTAHLLSRLLENLTVDDLLKLSTKLVVLKTCRFGKHSGALWMDVPLDYLQWASRQDFDPDVAFTVKHEIQRRKSL